MMKSLNRLPWAIWPRFHRNDDEHLSPYYTFQDYRQTWGMTIFILACVRSPVYGTEQRRQRSEASNQKRVSWASSSD